jgi:hypothetical protein
MVSGGVSMKIRCTSEASKHPLTYEMRYGWRDGNGSWIYHNEIGPSYLGSISFSRQNHRSYWEVANQLVWRGGYED